MLKKYKLIFVVLCVFVFCGCSKNNEKKESLDKINEDKNVVAEIVPELSIEEIEKNKYEEAIENFVSSLSIEQQIGQMFLITIGGTEFNENYYDLENFIAPGGYLLFAYNFVDGKQTIDYTSSISNWYSKNGFIKPYFSVDQEGGLVNRLRNVASPLPSANSVAKFLSEDLAKTIYDYAAMQLSSLGIHVNIGPVVEILTDENKKFLDTRSFGDFEKVFKYSRIFVNSMLENNIFPVVKHFPGNNADDPHLGLPIIDFNQSQIEEILIKPFAEIENKDKVGVLVAHSVVPNLLSNSKNKNIPSCLSYDVVTDLLVNRLGYSNLVFSDDLLMSALQDNGYDSVASISMAIQAGVDVLMISQKEYMPFVNQIAELCKNDENLCVNIKKSVKKIIDFKIKHGLLIYENGQIILPEGMSELDLKKYQLESFEQFQLTFSKGTEFYHNYWG